MKPIFKTVAIIGLGLIGGSIALEIKRKNLASKVIGVSRSVNNRRIALKRKAVDHAYPHLGDFLQEVDLVILATPVGTVISFLKKIQPFLNPKSLVTDVGSTKEEIVRFASKFKKLYFIGGHPIAGTEHSGMKAAELDLFKKKKWILTPTVSTPASLRNRLCRLIRAFGAQVVMIDAERHDRIFAAVSHLPNLLAYTLSNTIETLKNPQFAKFAGSSFRDMTRVASSSPEMWRDISLSNRVELLRVIKQFETEMEKFKRILSRGEEGLLLKFFERGKRFREQLS